MRFKDPMVRTLIATVLLLPPVAIVAAQTRTTPASGDPISQAIRVTWEGAKRNLTESAEQMPEADYAFKPTEQVRTFGQILAHVAGADYVFCAPARAEKPPFEEDHFEKIAKTKAEIVKALNDSLAYCDAAYVALTDRSAAEMVTLPFNMGTQARASALIRNTVHLQEHYGNLVTYFRIKGMVPVPPSSRRQ
jgi:uncharacterized damage-inducible protein DinB